MSDDFTGSLTATPKRAMDRNLMGNDAATLRALCGTLNNPNITGAVVPPEDKITQITAPMPLAAEMRNPTSPLAAEIRNPTSPLAAAVLREMRQAAVVLQENTLSPAQAAPLTPHQKQEAKQAVTPTAATVV